MLDNDFCRGGGLAVDGRHISAVQAQEAMDLALGVVEASSVQRLADGGRLAVCVVGVHGQDMPAIGFGKVVAPVSAGRVQALGLGHGFRIYGGVPFIVQPAFAPGLGISGTEGAPSMHGGE